MRLPCAIGEVRMFMRSFIQGREAACLIPWISRAPRPS
nr:MAG TPA: hypothetical protein [Caudoviricetes sp.]